LAVVPDGAVGELPAEVVDLLEALDAELPKDDAVVRTLAFRLAKLSATAGPAAVSALRALGELVAAQRAGGPPVPAPKIGVAVGRRKRP
jgi:hypothetical protein